jgi:hypothetical protein
LVDELFWPARGMDVDGVRVRALVLKDSCVAKAGGHGDRVAKKNLAGMSAGAARRMSAKDHDLGGLQLEEIPVAGPEPDHAFRSALADALVAIDSALKKDKNDVEAMNTRIRTTTKYLAKLQKSVNAEGNDGVPTSWQGWGLMLTSVPYFGLTVVPETVKIGQVWYWASQLFVMLLTLGLTISFWRKHLVMARVQYAVYCSAPWMIFFYTMMYYVVMLIADEEGFNISNRLSATTMTAWFLLFISLDATDCSRCFRLFIFGFGFLGMVYALYLASFVWADCECCAAMQSICAGS